MNKWILRGLAPLASLLIITITQADNTKGLSANNNQALQIIKVAKSDSRRDHRNKNSSSQSSQPKKPRDHRLTLEQRQAEIEPFRQWMIGANKTGKVEGVLVSGANLSSHYNFKNLTHKKFLQYEKQGATGGINLGWTKNASNKTADKRARWILVPEVRTRNDSQQVVRKKPIQYGEKVAIAWVVPGENGAWNNQQKFLKQSSRRVGIDLDWSSKPVFQWTVLGGKPGTEVQRGKDKVVIYNLTNKEPLVYYPRKMGGQIGWVNKHSGSPLPASGVVVRLPDLPPIDVWLGLMQKQTQRSVRR